MADETLEALLWVYRMQHPIYALVCGDFYQDDELIIRMRYPVADAVGARRLWSEELSNQYDAAHLLMIWADGSRRHIETFTKP